MSEKDNESPEWLEKLFSTQFILTAILILGIVLIDKIEKPAPNKLIKRELSNDKLITVKTAK